jgi:3-dehydroquinate synthase
MEKIDVCLGARGYPIYVGEGLLNHGSLIEETLPGPDILIVTNDVVAPLYLESLRKALSHCSVRELVLPDGEQFKTLDTVSKIFDELVAAGLGRDCTVVALGGGVVGDMAGFAAACYQRGVGFVQVPTTLLAQVDSSVGGKTAVNHPAGKNLIGAFYQPVCVVADTTTLATLEEREYRAGLAEVIKYGLILDAGFFDWLEQALPALLRRETAALEKAITRSCQIKADIVARDETEQGVRALLNLGHTFGHAIEAVYGYGRWLHGEAVAAGMTMAAEFSARLGHLSASAADRLAMVLEASGLPTRPPALDYQRFVAALNRDKKVRAGQLRLVLLDDIGHARLTAQFPSDELDRFLRERLGSCV